MESMQQPDMFSLDNQSNSNVQPGSNDWLLSEFGLQLDAELPDGKARLQGVHPHHSYIVQAPAGSGKTSLLVQRFLALLSQVDSPEQIVAMTFTKKAAAEMRQRIIEALELGKQPLSSDASLVDSNTWKLAKKALQRDNDQAWSLLQNPNRLRIKTIDGLNSYLVGQMPLLSKMGGQAQLLQDAYPTYQEAVRMVLKDEHLEEPVGRLLRLVNGCFNRAESLLCDMLAKRDQWMRTLIQYQGDEARHYLESAIEEIVNKTLSEQLQALYYLKPAFEEACALADYAVQHDQVQLAEIGGAWPFAEDASAVKQWQVLADWLLTQKDEVRKSVTKNNGFPAGKGEAKENKERFLDVLEQVRVAAANHAEVLPALMALKGLPEADYSGQQWLDLQWLIQLLRVSAAYLKVVFQQSGQADYIEIAQAANQSLGSELEPTDLAQQLDYQIQHLLVDEFQDTSSEQYRLLTQLIAGWQPDDGRTFFVVGDPMQSIYRFREAEVGNFLEAWKGQLGSVKLRQLNLEVNFRSTAGVVNWVNQAFAKVLPKQNQIEKGAVTYSASIPFSKDNTAAVTPHWVLNQSAQQEAQEILAVIKERLSDFGNQTGSDKIKKIAILGRSRSSLMDIAALLKQHEIGFRAVDLESLADRQEVQDILALSRALLHLADKPAWIALLRSPLVGLSLKDMHCLFGDMPYQTVWSAIERFRASNKKSDNASLANSIWKFEEVEGLSQQGQQRLLQSIPVIDHAIKRLGSLPFATLVRESWLQLDGPLTVENTLALENVDVFCQTLANSDSPIINLQQLEKQMDSLYARPDSSPQSQYIELMTMHKSKGLEFDTVILPGLGRKPRSDDANLVSWFQFLSETGREQLVIAPLDQKGKEPSALRNLLKRIESEKQTFELGRLLYVAATRAKAKLHLFGQAKYKPTEKSIEAGDYSVNLHKDSLLATMWPFVETEFTDLAEDYNEFDDEPVDEEIPWPKVSRLKLQRQGFSDYKKNALFEVESAKTVTSLENETQQQTEHESLVFSQQNALLNTTVGNLVHAVFEQMVSEGLSDWNLERLQNRLPIYQQWLAQQGLPESDMPEALRRVEQSIKNGLFNEKLRWALDAAHPESAVEYPLTSLENGQVANHIVDRTFIDQSGTRWIVDYKTSVSDEDNIDKFVQYQTDKYQPQLQRYGQLFDQIEQRPQKWVLYFSYLNIWHELN